MSPSAYFRVKTFSIYQTGSVPFVLYPVSDEMKEFICSEHYPLDSIHGKHYDPEGFFKYIKFISNKNPDVKFRIFYKYILTKKRII